MIEFAKREHRNELMTLWKTCFPLISTMEVNYFFSHDYQEDNTLMYMQNSRVIGGVTRMPANILFNGRYLRSSIISGLVVDPRFRHQGVMHQLMQKQLEHLQHTELVSLALARNNTDLSEFGFTPVYFRNNYEITRDQVGRINDEGISFRFRANDVLQLYARYIKRFNGFIVRDKKDVEKVMRRAQALGGKAIFYYDGNDQLQGYCAYHMDGLVVTVDEIVYMDTIALVKLLNYALLERHYITLSVSDSEDLLKIFPNAKVSPTIFAGMRINDYDLFNRLYNCDVSSVAQAIAFGNPRMHCLVNF